MKITKTTIDKMSFEGASEASQDIRWDDEIPGFGVRVWPNGKKTFVIRYRANGRRRYLTLGRYGVITLFQARELARERLFEVAKGKDPQDDRKRERTGKTFADLKRAYIERHAKPRKKSWLKDEQRLDKHVMPKWQSRPVRSIKREDAIDLHERIGETAPIMANRVIAMLSKMFSLASQWGYLDEGMINPVASIEPFPEKSRDRFVTQDEMPKLLVAIESEENPYIRALIWLYLLTGLRKDELRTLKWSDIDLKRSEVRLADTKTGRPHYLPFPIHAIEILKSLPRQIDNPFVFCGRKYGYPVHNVSKPWLRIRKAAEIEDVRLHDLRRTLGSWLAISGHSLPLIGRILNHTNASTTQVYARFSQDPLREALEGHSLRLIQLRDQPQSQLDQKSIGE